MARTPGPRIRRWSTQRLIRRALAHSAPGAAWNAVALLQRRGCAVTLAQVQVLARSANAHRRALAMDIAAQLQLPGRAGMADPAAFAPEATQAL
ncbi:MAG TPA: hypothetical protein VES00_15595, partial [Burkholderiaceae bacterium]|nr:hypothetical protein [Burkholderiaceae bacterium]